MRDYASTSCEDPITLRRRTAGTVAVNPSGQPDPLEGAALVRVPAGPGWVATLPVVPRGASVTVTVGHRGVRAPVDRLAGRGYAFAGVSGTARNGDVVDVFVPAAMREAAPEWWTSLITVADRIFDLRMGPVRAILADEIDVHVRAVAS